MKTRLPAELLLQALILPACFLGGPGLGLRPSLSALARRRRMHLGAAVHLSGFHDRVLDACSGKPACLAEPACTIFTAWSSTSRFSWIPTHYPGWSRAAIMDHVYRPKRAYEALREALEALDA